MTWSSFASACRHFLLRDFFPLLGLLGRLCWEYPLLHGRAGKAARRRPRQPCRPTPHRKNALRPETNASASRGEILEAYSPHSETAAVGHRLVRGAFPGHRLPDRDGLAGLVGLPQEQRGGAGRGGAFPRQRWRWRQEGRRGHGPGIGNGAEPVETVDAKTDPNPTPPDPGKTGPSSTPNAVAMAPVAVQNRDDAFEPRTVQSGNPNLNVFSRVEKTAASKTRDGLQPDKAKAARQRRWHGRPATAPARATAPGPRPAGRPTRPPEVAAALDHDLQHPQRPRLPGPAAASAGAWRCRAGRNSTSRSSATCPAGARRRCSMKTSPRSSASSGSTNARIRSVADGRAAPGSDAPIISWPSRCSHKLEKKLYEMEKRKRTAYPRT